MRIVGKIQRLLSNVLGRRRAEDGLDAELRAYVDDLTERNVTRGMALEEARRQALIETTGIEQVKEEVRQTWLGHGIDTAQRDIRQAFRSLARSPGFTVVVIGTLTLGIGANLTMFSLMRAVLWRPLPYPEPDRIVTIEVDARGVANTGATPGEVLDLKERAQSFEQVSMISSADVDLEYEGESEHLQAASVSDNLFPLLGVRPALGRTVDSRIDEGKGQVFAVVISDELWRRRFSADPGIIGKTVLVNNLRAQIVGVLPTGFRLYLPPEVSAPEQVDIWLPSPLEPTRQYRGIPVVARLKPGVRLDQANAELETLAARFEREYPDFYSGGKGWQASPADRGRGGRLHFTARLLHEDITHEARPALFLLSSAVGFVLLIACVNIANLMLARGSARQREFEIRLALGAGKSRIIRQLLTESLIIAVAAATIALCCARLALTVITSQTASHIPLQSRIGVDAPVAIFALALSVITSILFGLLPAWQLASGTGGVVLRAGRMETVGSTARQLQRALVMAEVALSIVPLACGGLMLRSFVNLLRAPLGFNPAHVVTAEVPFSLRQHPPTEQRWALMRELVNQVGALPGVERVSAASPLPLAGDQQTRRVGRADQPDATPILATQQGAMPGYLCTIGTPLLKGRDFTDADIVPGRNVTIIDERLARQLWPEGAIGKRLTVYRTGWRHELEVIGVTAAVRATRVRDANIPHFMLPDEHPMSLVIKTSQTAAQLGPGLRQAVSAAHTGRAPFDIRPMSDYVSDSIGDTRFILLVLAAFAGASVLLAAVGLYGTLAYLTAQRTREFGIRLALGSSVGAILSIVVKESVLLAAAGTALGLLGVAAATGAIREMLYGVRPLDSGTLAAVVGLVGLVALGAALIPAWRAARIDPQISLRSE